MSKSIEERVKIITNKMLGSADEEMTPEASFVNDLDADSLDAVELVMCFEEYFDIEISDEDAEKLTTIKAATDYIESKVLIN